MHHHSLPISNAESLAVDQTLNGCKLVQQNKICVVNVVVDCVKIAREKFIFKRIVASLLETHSHDTTAHFEKILDDVVTCTCIPFMGYNSIDLNVKLELLRNNHIAE